MQPKQEPYANDFKEAVGLMMIFFRKERGLNPQEVLSDEDLRLLMSKTLDMVKKMEGRYIS